MQALETNNIEKNSLKVALIIFILAALGTSLQAYFLGLKTFCEGCPEYTHYNNYIIFKNAFYHLIHHKDLYVLYNEEQFDLFKYSPAFALLMGSMAWMPNLLGLLTWNLINSLVLFFAIWKFPLFKTGDRNFFLIFILVEMITALQNAQSNSLIAGLLILTYNNLEKGKSFLATLFIMISIFIKIFGVVGFAMFLFYPDKLKSMAYAIFWFLVFAFIPVLFIPFTELINQYKSWWLMLSNDHDASYGISVMGFFHSWFGLHVKNLSILLGVILFCLPMINLNHYKDSAFRALYLASVLLWIILFNHKSESPTFIIAICGVGIWFFTQAQSTINKILLLLCFVFCELAPTDVFPLSLRHDYVIPYVIKVLPCILVWLKLIFDSMSFHTHRQHKKH